MARAAFGTGFMLPKDNPKRAPPVPKAPRQKFFDDQGRPIDEPLRHKTSPEEMSALENIDYYHALRVPEDATPEEVKKGFYRSALKYHPDRSKDADTSEDFQLAKKAFAVLSNDRLRRIYDEARKEERLRTIGGRKGQAPGDLEIDPETVRPDALVITCDFCRRPSSDKCGVCQLNMCGPCKFKPHQAPGFRMHWPFVNSSKFSLKLIQQQKEREEKERLKLMWYGDSEKARQKREHAFLQTAKACRDPSKLKDGAEDWASHFHLDLGMYYAWTQDETSVCIAVRLPAADTTQKVAMNAEGDRLVITQEGLEEPILDRRLVHQVPQQEVEMFTMDSLQHCVIVLEKSPWMPSAAKQWRKLFQGDSDYCRYSGPPPYTVTHPEEGWTHVTLPLPPEVQGGDIDVRVDTHRLEVRVGDALHVDRHFRENLTAQRTDSTWRLEVEESGTQRLVVVLRTFEDFGTWGGHLNEERRTARIPTRAYVNCEESVPVLFQEDQDPQMVMAACTAVLHMEHGDKFLPRASLGVDATNYLGVLDGTGTPPPQYKSSKPEIDYTVPYPWSQTRTTVEIQIPIPRRYLDSVEVHIKTRELKVVVGGTPMGDVALLRYIVILIGKGSLGGAIICICFFFGRMQCSWTDLMIEASYVEKMKDIPERASDIITWVWIGIGVGGLFATLVISPCIDNLGVFTSIAIPCAISALPVIPAALGWMTEIKCTTPSCGVRWNIMKQKARYFGCAVILAIAVLISVGCGIARLNRMSKAIVAVSVSVVVFIGAVVLLPHKLWGPMLYMFLANALALQTTGFVDNFYLDAANQEESDRTGYPICEDCPHFDNYFYTTVVGIWDNLFMVIGSWLFNYWMSAWTYRKALVVTQLMVVVVSLFDIIQYERWNKHIGIPDWVFMLGKAAFQNSVSMLNFMPTTILISKLCPLGAESTVFALLAGFSNFGQTVSSYLGAYIQDWIGMGDIGSGTVDDFSNAWIACVINAVCPVAVLIILPFLIPNNRMTDPLAKLDSEEDEPKKSPSFDDEDTESLPADLEDELFSPSMGPLPTPCGADADGETSTDRETSTERPRETEDKEVKKEEEEEVTFRLY